MNKQALLKQRGQEAIHLILAESGGVYTTPQVAALLGISSEEVSALAERRCLLAIQLDGEAQFPTWQFDENGVIPKFLEVMGMLDTSSPAGAVRFFLTHNEDLGQTAIAALKETPAKDLEVIKLLAQQFNRQVAR